MKKKSIILLIIVIFILLLGASYSWFNYRGELSNQRLVAGDVFLTLTDGLEGINLTGIYPMTKEEARARNDNYVTFTVRGKNTSDKNVHYEIYLKYGTDLESPYERFMDKDIVFDLIEIDNNTETYLLDAVSFDSINNRKIWIDSVVHNTNSTVERVYKLRMWLSDRVIISDTDINANYAAEDYRYHYMNVKFGVEGDLNEKSLPSSATTRESFVENGKSYFMTYLTNDYLLEEEGELLDENDIVTLEITNPENKIYFSYIDSKGNEDTNQNESLALTYNYNRNETVNIKVFTESKNDSNVNTTLHFKVTKNGEIVQEYNKEIYVIGNNYCLNNGFTKLNDCILVTENLSDSVNDAKTYIASKGSPNINQTAPIMTYTYYSVYNTPQTNVVNNNVSTWYFSTDYTFDESTGRFRMTNTISDALSENYIGYYTCGNRDIGSTCNDLYKITGVHLDTNYIDGYKYSYREVSSFDSEQGIYRVEVGNNTGNYSYIYRGEVINNNVKFGDLFWKIIRINEDGSIRMIYNGTTLAADGNKTAGLSTGIGKYIYNNGYGPTFMGYMYNVSTTPIETNYAITETFKAGTPYYWGESYTYTTDASDYTDFKIATGTNNYPLVQMTTDEMINNPAQLAKTPYTCMLTSSTGSCVYMIKVNSFTSATRANVTYVSMNYNTREEVQINNRSSVVKKALDNWYANTFSVKQNNGKNVTSYIADSVFCNDKTIATGTGYKLHEDTRLRAYDSVSSTNPVITLACPNKNDSFTVEETSTTNGSLTYPVGLITGDEIIYTGALWGYKNSRYYLHSGEEMWLFTPQSYRYSYSKYNVILFMDQNDQMNSGSARSTSRLIRPVINLKANTEINYGDGSATNPYIIE